MQLNEIKNTVFKHKLPIVIVLAIAGVSVPAAIMKFGGKGGGSTKERAASSPERKTPVRPLAKADKIDSRLRALSKNERDGLPSALKSLQSFHDISVVTYSDTELSKKEHMRYDFTLAKDADGKVLGFQASFWSKSEKASGKGSSTVEKLAHEYWRDFAGSDPKFEKTHTGSGVDAREFLEARFENDGRCGEWRKRYLKPGETDSIVDDVTVYVK